MSTFLNKLSKKFIFNKEVFKKFPLSFLAMFISIFFTISYLQKVYYFSQTTHEKIIFISITSIIFASALHLFFQNKSYNFTFKYIIAMLFLILAYISIDKFSSSAFIFTIAVISTLSFSKFILVQNSNKELLDFNINLFVDIIFAILISSILGFGIFAIFKSIEYLFGISFLTEFYEEIYTIIALFIFPALVLSNINNSNTINTKTSFLSISSTILVPMLVIYTIILYAYYIKIIVLWELPKGGLAWISVVFLSAGLLVKVLLFNIENKSAISKYYYKYYYYLTIIPLIFLFISIYIRVSQYGITINRYLIIALALWLSFITIANIIKKDFDFKYITVSLCLIFLFASISPYNASSLSTNSQIEKLKQLLIANKILINDKIIPAKDTLDFENRISISSVINYLIYNNDAKEQLNLLFKNNFKNSEEILNYINVKYANVYMKKDHYPKSYKFKDKFHTIYDIKDYSYFVCSYLSDSQSLTYHINKNIEINLINNILEIKFKNKKTINFNLDNIIKKLENQENNNIVDLDNFTLYKTIDKQKIKLQILYIELSKEQKNKKVSHLKFNFYF